MVSICRHVLITGTVQGVGYRFSTAQTATQLGLHGWVKNLPDGRVEALFEGDRSTVETMLQWCYQGPPAAIVTDITVADFAVIDEVSQRQPRFQIISD